MEVDGFWAPIIFRTQRDYYLRTTFERDAKTLIFLDYYLSNGVSDEANSHVRESRFAE